MSNTAFPAELLADLSDSNVLFATILHLPTLGLNSHSKGFSAFLGEIFENNNGVSLVKQLPEFDPILLNIDKDPKGEWAFDHAQEIAEARGDFEFLVKLQIFSSYNFSFTSEGEFFSSSVSNSWRNVWIFATDMQHAAVQAIEINDQFFNEAMQKAKLEQGFANAE